MRCAFPDRAVDPAHTDDGAEAVAIHADHLAAIHYRGRHSVQQDSVTAEPGLRELAAPGMANAVAAAMTIADMSFALGFMTPTPQTSIVKNAERAGEVPKA